MKATVAGEIAYGEIENRLKGKNDKIDPNSFEYAQFDPDSEITSDITAEQIRKGKKELKEIGNKIVKGDLKGAAGQFLGLSGKAGKVLIDNANDIAKGGKVQEKVINETKEAIDKEVVGPVKKKISEDKKKADKKREEKDRILKQEKPKNLEELKEFEDFKGKLPKGTKLVFEYEDGRKVTYNSFEEFKRGTAEENKKIAEYSEKINQKIGEYNAAKRRGDKKGADQYNEEIKKLYEEQNEILKAQRLRVSGLGAKSETSELVNNAKDYRNGVLTIKGDKYSASVVETYAAMGESLIQHSGMTEQMYYGMLNNNTGTKGSQTGLMKDNKNNPEAVENIKSGMEVGKPKVSPNNEAKQKEAVYSSGLDEVNPKEIPYTSNKIGSKNMEKYSYKIEKPKGVENNIKEVMKGNDNKGKITEEIFNTAFENDPKLKVYNGKYGSNNGFDHVVEIKETGEVWILESKQLSEKGTITLSNKGVQDSFGNTTRQGSSGWIEGVLDKLDNNNPTKKLIREAQKSKKLRYGITEINKKTGEMEIIPVIIKNK